MLKEIFNEDLFTNGFKYFLISSIATIILAIIINSIAKLLINNGTPIIEIYFNLIIKYFPYILKKCTLETIQSREKTENFEYEFKSFIKACLKNYAEYSLNFIDTKMRFIIQELNNPLKYDFDEFPFLAFYSIQSKPNRDDFINKFPDNDFSLMRIISPTLKG